MAKISNHSAVHEVSSVLRYRESHCNLYDLKTYILLKNHFNFVKIVKNVLIFCKSLKQISF